MRILTAAAFALVTLAASEPPQTDVAALLARAGAYVGRLEEECSTIIADEQYEQIWTDGTRRAAASGASIPNNAVRRLGSELLFVWLPSERSWLAVRDVTRVDGHEVTDEERPLKRLLRSRDLISTTRLRDILRENSRYNLGDIQRNFNDPTFGLLPLDREAQPRFAFTIVTTGRVAGVEAADVHFVETSTPTIIRGVAKTTAGAIAEHDVVLSGTVSIEIATGAVVRTEIEMADMLIRSRGRLTTVFAKQPRFGFWLPASMREEYDDLVRRDHRVRTSARYSNYRRFETAGRLVVPN